MPNQIDINIDPRYINDSEPVSNMMEIHKRDTAGNIILIDKSASNQLLVIEPIKKQYSVENILRILDTNFEYYSFPVQTNFIVPESTDTNIINNLLNEAEAEISRSEADAIAAQLEQEQATDIIYARLKPSADFDITPITEKDNFIPFGFDEYVDGITQKTKNYYTITPDIKQSGKNLRFRIKITHLGVQGGSIYWSINKSGPDLPEVKAYGDGIGGIRAWAANDVNGNNWGENIKPGEIRSLNIDFVLNNNSFKAGERFIISVYTFNENGHRIISDQSYWTVTDASKNVDTFNQPI